MDAREPADPADSPDPADSVAGKAATVGSGVPLPPPLPPVRGARAAWWAWPMVVACLLPFDWIAARFDRGEGPREGGPAAERETDAGELAMLKFQAQMVVGLGRVQPDAARKSLADLAASAGGEKAVAALALLESFVALEEEEKEEEEGGGEESLATRLGRRDGALAEATRSALREGVDEAGRSELRRSLGWFAELAPGPGLAEPPRAAAIRAKAMALAAGFGVLMTAVVLAIMAGVVLIVLQMRRLGAGTARNAFAPSAVCAGVMLECFALYLGCIVGGAYLGAWLGGLYSPVGYGAAVLLPLLWPRLRGIGWREFFDAAGLHRGSGWWREIGAGCVGYLAVLAVASIGVAATLGLSFAADALSGMGGGGEADSFGDPARSAGPEVHPIVGWIYGGGFWERFACLALAAGFAPFFEELFFRGALHRHLRSRFRFFGAALLGSLIFAALHPQGLYGIPALAAMGMGFSLLREWRDSLVAPMTAHAINNGALVLMLWWVL
jgi:membrane protease YdiL (CAAX protease family)